MIKPPLDPELLRHDLRIMIGYWRAIAFAAALALVSLGAIHAVVRSLGDVAFQETTDLIAVQRLRIADEVRGRKARGFLLTANAEYLSELDEANREHGAWLSKVRRSLTDPEDVGLLDRVERADKKYQSAMNRVIALRQNAAEAGAIGLAFESEVQPTRDELSHALHDLTTLQEQRLKDASVEARKTVSAALVVLVSLGGFTLLLSVLLGLRLTRALRTQCAQRLEMARTLERVEELNRELDAFAGRVAHDLRNLFSPISLAAGLLPRSLDEPDLVQSLTEKIRRGINRSLAMMNGLLAFSRSGAPDRLAACSVSAVVNDAIEQLDPLAMQIGSTVTCDVEDAKVACSSELLNVVVLNLLGNALKFMEGCERRAVTISAKTVDGACEIAVEDTGPGIPEDALGRIFQPFYRVPGATAPGAGLGLATVARIVEAHGGRISVESKPGQGATFHVSLPIAAGSAPNGSFAGPEQREGCQGG